MKIPSHETINRLVTEKIVWISTTKLNTSPHLVPVWFVWIDFHLYICISGKSIKAGNIKKNPQVAFALEDGIKPVIGEGEASDVLSPWPSTVIAAFKDKYDWSISDDKEYNLLLKVSVNKWLSW